MAAFNPFDQALFDVRAGCMPCCPPPGCPCALLIPFAFSGSANYSTITEAQDAILYSAYDCLSAGFTSGYGPGVANPISITVAYTPSGTTVWTVASTATAGEFIIAYLNGFFDGPATLTFAFTNSSGIPGSQVELLDCDTRDVLDDDSSSAASGTLTLSVPAPGNYYIRTRSSDMTVSGNTAVYTMTSDADYVLNPVIALWDDSGTTRQLEACPKLHVPVDTDSTDFWFSSLTDAETFYAAQVATSCVAISVLPTGVISAVDGGSSLSIHNEATTPITGVSIVQGSVNAVAGETLSFAYTISGGTPVNVQVRIKDYAGAVIQTLTAGPNPLVSSALPYTGRYTCELQVILSSGTVTADWVITSSGTMTVNPVQALYATDPILDCPARLDCADASPGGGSGGGEGGGGGEL